MRKLVSATTLFQIKKSVDKRIRERERRELRKFFNNNFQKSDFNFVEFLPVR
jgi:hypothetical protein